MMPLDRQPQRMWSPALSATIVKPVIAVVMGVSGSGKTTVSVLLSAALGCQFQEGDDLHSAANVEKMHSGTPLTDADRLPWLRKIGEEIDGWRARGESGVLTCSALKRASPPRRRRGQASRDRRGDRTSVGGAARHGSRS